MCRQNPTRTLLLFLAFLCLAPPVFTQTKAPSFPILFTVVDENGIAVHGAALTIAQPNAPTVELLTDQFGHAQFVLTSKAPYQVLADKQGFYQTTKGNLDPAIPEMQITMAHEQYIRQKVNVTASNPAIDPQQFADASTMSMPEIVNIPYVVDRDIQDLFPFNPGVIQDPSGQAHVAGSPTYATLDELDDMNLRSPDSGDLSLHVSTDAVRNIVIESTRYPVQYGRATGGIIAYSSGMGDNHLRFNATDFLPSYILNNGVHFDKFIPRITVSGPVRKNHAWFFNGFDMEYASGYIIGLPANADTDPLWDESDLLRFQFKLTPRNNLFASALFNDDYSRYSGLSTLIPQASTTKTDTVAWLPYFRDQQVFSNGSLLDVSAGITRVHNGSEPNGDTPYAITPNVAEGSYFQSLTDLSSRFQENAILYLNPRKWLGTHEAQFGVDFEQIRFGQRFFNTSISYLRENGTLVRQSTFPSVPAFQRGNADDSGYAQDHWQLSKSLAIEPGLRFDWDEIVRRPLYSPRFAAVFAPGKVPSTKISAGIGVYYEHTQLSYLEEALDGPRYDTNYAADGVTPIGPVSTTTFTADYSQLRAPRVINWSVELEQKLPFSTYATFSYMHKSGKDFLVFADENLPSFFGNYVLTNQRTSNYHAETITLRHNFPHGYVVYGAYTRSQATTNAAVTYSPTIGELGPQQPGPEAWNVPNRLLAWGWLPTFFKEWDLVYALDYRTGLPYTAINADQVVVGKPNSYTFPVYMTFDPGVEWKFHFGGYYFGLRGFFENITDRQNPMVIQNNIDSPEFGVPTEPLGRALSARLRLIGTDPNKSVHKSWFSRFFK